MKDRIVNNLNEDVVTIFNASWKYLSLQTYQIPPQMQASAYS